MKQCQASAQTVLGLLNNSWNTDAVGRVGKCVGTRLPGESLGPRSCGLSVGERDPEVSVDRCSWRCCLLGYLLRRGWGGFIKCFEISAEDTKRVLVGKVMHMSLLLKSHQKMSMKITIHRTLPASRSWASTAFLRTVTSCSWCC